MFQNRPTVAWVPTCLVVEDSDLDRRIMRRVLARQGHPLRVLFARTLAEARQLLAQEDIAIVFLDNALPDGNAADHLASIIGGRTGRRVPVVMVSDWPTPFMFAKARAENVVDIWSKRDFTVDRVQRALGSVGRRRA